MRKISRKEFLLIGSGAAAAAVMGSRFVRGNSGHSIPSNQFVPMKIREMPHEAFALPESFWQKRAKDCYELLFDFNATGKNLPVIWNDTERRHYDFDMFALPAYLGDYRQNLQIPHSHEALSSLGSVLGATLSGIDMTTWRNRDWVKEILGFHQKDGLAKVLLNQTGESGSESSFWYMIYPNLALYAINSMYPNKQNFEPVSREIAEQFVQMLDYVKKIDGTFSFDFTGYNFLRKEGIYGAHREPDAAAGVAWILYMAYVRFQDPRYLKSAKKCLDFLNVRTADQSPFYEVLLGYGVTLTARMNKEVGTTYDVDKFLAWIFDHFSEARAGWGIISDEWGEYQVHGLQGSTTDSGGYAFAFNTFNIACALAPLPLYDEKYTYAIGKWLHQLTSCARLFYPDQIAPEQQSQPELIGLYKNSLAYEGIRKEWAFTSPYATADSRRMTWAETDIGIYGSGLVGALAGLVVPQNDPNLAIFEISKTDFWGKNPRTHLVFNHSKKNTQYLGTSIPAGAAVLVKITG